MGNLAIEITRRLNQCTPPHPRHSRGSHCQQRRCRLKGILKVTLKGTLTFPAPCKFLATANKQTNMAHQANSLSTFEGSLISLSPPRDLRRLPCKPYKWTRNSPRWFEDHFPSWHRQQRGCPGMKRLCCGPYTELPPTGCCGLL